MSTTTVAGRVVHAGGDAAHAVDPDQVSDPPRRTAGEQHAVRRFRAKKRIAVAQPTRVLVRRPRFRRAVVTGCGAAAALVVGSSIVPRHAHTIGGRALLDLPAVVFLVLVVSCARSSAVELDALARWRGGQTAGSAMRMLVTGLGYAVAVVGMLSMLSIPVGHLLLGGAIAGVVIGIAAQQSLGNVFAGLGG